MSSPKKIEKLTNRLHFPTRGDELDVELNNKIWEFFVSTFLSPNEEKLPHFEPDQEEKIVPYETINLNKAHVTSLQQLYRNRIQDDFIPGMSQHTRIETRDLFNEKIINDLALRQESSICLSQEELFYVAVLICNCSTPVRYATLGGYHSVKDKPTEVIATENACNVVKTMAKELGEKIFGKQLLTNLLSLWGLQGFSPRSVSMIVSFGQKDCKDIIYPLNKLIQDEYDSDWVPSTRDYECFRNNGHFEEKVLIKLVWGLESLSKLGISNNANRANLLKLIKNDFDLTNFEVTGFSSDINQGFLDLLVKHVEQKYQRELTSQVISPTSIMGFRM